MQVVSREFGKALVVEVVGRADHAGAPQLEAALAGVLEQAGAEAKPLVLDFSGVDYISSVGLRVLMLTARKVAAARGKIAITGLQPLVREVFEISRFHMVVPVYGTLDEARSALGVAA